MQGQIQFLKQAGVAWVTLSHADRFNAMSLVMWRELRSVFERIQQSTDVRCVVVAGEGGNFCAGGDISEYPDFRFNAISLRDFHENEVWGALRAMLACDVPIVAKIEGNCMGAGLEIASCCDIRLASVGARFGAPIAKLGFPMAPQETRLVARELGLATARQMLLEAAILGTAEMKATGFLSRVLEASHLDEEAKSTACRIATLAPAAARANKQVIRGLLGSPQTIPVPDSTYAYADSAEHREGIQAFLEKRKPVF
jgi:enoyl-CoA hydratase/carnithine racemase